MVILARANDIPPLSPGQKSLWADRAQSVVGSPGSEPGIWIQECCKSV